MYFKLKDDYDQNDPKPLLEDEGWMQKFQHKTVEFLDTFIEEDKFIDMSWNEVYEWSLATVVKERKQTKTIGSQLSKIFEQKSRTLKRKKKEMENMYMLEKEALRLFDFKVYDKLVLLNIKYYVCCLNVFIGVQIGRVQDLLSENLQHLKDFFDELAPYLGEVWCQLVELTVEFLQKYETTIIETVVYLAENKGVAAVALLIFIGFIIAVYMILRRVLVKINYFFVK